MTPTQRLAEAIHDCASLQADELLDQFTAAVNERFEERAFAHDFDKIHTMLHDWMQA